MLFTLSHFHSVDIELWHCTPGFIYFKANTVGCHHNAVQRNATMDEMIQWLMWNTDQNWTHKDTQYFVLPGELLGVFRKYLENLPRYNGTAVYELWQSYFIKYFRRNLHTGLFCFALFWLCYSFQFVSVICLPIVFNIASPVWRGA